MNTFIDFVYTFSKFIHIYTQMQNLLEKMPQTVAMIDANKTVIEPVSL